ncbi:MAG: FAD-dependent oxidoreductase, partial [Alphaproteobacteria bacterium]
MKNHRNLLIYQTSSLRQSDFQAYDKFLKYIKKIKIKKLILICIILVFTGCANQVSQVASYDIVIYGGTSAGVIAAVQAKKMGKSVVLIDPGEHLGGLSSAGL